MLLWTTFVDLLREVLFGLAVPLGGSLGGAIIALSIGVRLALLPMTLRLAIRARETQRKLRSLAPELEPLRAKHAADPLALAQATRALYQSHGVELVPSGMLRSLIIQAPVGAALYQAIAQGLVRGGRFLWVADLARPDLMVALIAAGLGSAAAVIAGSSVPENASRNVAALSGIVTFFVAWRLAAGLGLYWAASALVGTLQAILVRRHPADSAAA